MAVVKKLALTAVGLLSLLPGSSAVENMDRDVVIIGGGSSGSYCAVRLQQMGKSVALVEKENRLGGHTNTYVDSATGKTFDYGVHGFVNTSEVRDFFGSLNVPLAAAAGLGTAVTADFRHRSSGPAWPAINGTEEAIELQKYQTQLDKYPDLFLGYHLPDPVPEDLLMPWGSFLQKYGLKEMAYDGFLQFQGSGNYLDQPTLYIMKLFNPMQVRARLQKLKVENPNGDTQALWDAALSYLGGNAILSAHVTKITRRDNCIEVLLKTGGVTKSIRAKKIIITVPPKVPLLPFLDMTPEERGLFSQFNNSYYYNAVVSKTGFPASTSVLNYDRSGYGGVPRLPGVYFFQSMGVEDYYALQYSSPYYMTDDAVKADIVASVNNAKVGLSLPESNPAATLNAFNDHSPYLLTVPVSAIKSGFYKRLTALQGPRNTYWTGHSWSSGSSSTIWDFNENELLPAVVASL